MQLQTRLYKMNKIAKRHHRYSMHCKFVKYWKLYANEEQTKRFLAQQRDKRKAKIQSLISCVKTKAMNAIDDERESKNIQTKEIKIKKKPMAIKTVKPKKMIS